MPKNPSPRGLLLDQVEILAARIVHRLLHSQARPDEYRQLAPYVDRLFEQRKKRKRGLA